MAMEKREKRLLTAKEVAAYLQVNQTTIYRLVRRSQIPAFKMGGDWRFNIESIDNWRLSADNTSMGQATLAAQQLVSRRANRASQPMPPSQLLPLSVTDTPGATAEPVRIYETISQMLGPVAEMSRMLPILKRIAEAIEDKRDTSYEIARLYEGETIAFRIHSENLLKFVPSPFGAVDRDGHLVSFNDAYCQLFEFRRKQLRTARLTDLVHSDDLERFVIANVRLWRGGIKSVCLVARRLTGSGDAIPTRSTAWPIRSTPTAKPKYLAASLERIADRKEASALFARCANQLSKRRENFLARR
jgi:excisionase family DNA binding protein/PAS domain S-box-containing protein